VHALRIVINIHIIIYIYQKHQRNLEEHREEQKKIPPHDAKSTKAIHRVNIYISS
jgi:hypothetical protein